MCLKVLRSVRVFLYYCYLVSTDVLKKSVSTDLYCSTMIEIGRYLFIALSGLTLSVDGRFSENDKKRFLDYIFRLHNAVRVKHSALPLKRTAEFDEIASFKYNEWVNGMDKSDAPLGEMLYSMDYNNSTQLDIAEAIKYFSLSYERGNFYNYETNPISNYADGFTQIVWQATLKIGLTFRYDYNRYMVFAVYYPRGNVEGRYTLNVQRPINSQPARDPDIAGLIYQTEKEKFLDNILKLHNETRTNHGVQILERDNALDEEARSMLQRGIKYSTEEYGVNWLAFGNISVPLNGNEAKDVFSMWYKEKEFYDFCSGELCRIKYTDEFAQIVWQNTRTIGLDVQMRIVSGEYYEHAFTGQYEVIAVYEPRGNIQGKHLLNVFMLQIMDQGGSSGSN